MLKSLHLRNFTVFADAEFEFGPGLNVLVGTNGTGKTHVLKAGYAMLYTLTARLKAIKNSTTNKPTQLLILAPANKKLQNVFQPTPLHVNALINRSATTKAAVELGIEYPGGQVETSFKFSFSPPYQSAPGDVWTNNADKSVSFAPPVFIPAKEVLVMGWLPALYERFNIPFDETYLDALNLLFGPSLRQPEPAHIVNKLAQLIGGKVEEEGGHFYLASPDQMRLEMNLVAEGMRKFATLYKLLANGTLTPETTLFWDEPEANLNPALLKEMAVVLTELSLAGFQIILATHSLFLMRELHILAQQRKKPVRYFGLYAGEQGDVQVETTDDFMQLQHIAALDAELTQTFDFEAALDQDYAGDN